MRIITGIYKGRRFDVPNSFKARPTTDFAKENIFNVLRAYLDFEETRALDLFGGTGSISLELVSRGCPRVVTVEKDRQHHRFITQCAAALAKDASHPLEADTWLPLCGDVLKFVPRCHEPFGLVFADPPYALTELPQLPDLVLSSEALAPDGIFVLEHGKDNDFSMHPAFLEHRQYGAVNFTLFRRPEAGSGDD